MAPHRLTFCFHTLLEDLRTDPRANSWAGNLITDAACATLLHHVRDQGRFTTGDYDCLRAPWCAVMTTAGAAGCSCT